MGKIYKRIGDEIVEYETGEYVMALIGCCIGIVVLTLIVYIWAESSL